MGCSTSQDEGTRQPGEDSDDLVYEMQKREQPPVREKEGDETLLKADEEGVEQFMAVRPWVGALKAPTNPPNVDFSAPSMNLQLEYVNGYRCEDSRQNLFFTSDSSQIVYMTAAVGVVLDLPSNKQRFFGAGKLNQVDGHNDDIESLHVNPDRTLFATGQRGKNPSIYLWDIQSGDVVWKTLQGRDTRAAQLLRFSKDGKYIFTVDLHNDHNVHVFDWQANKKVGMVKTGGEPIFDMDTSSGSFAGAIALKRGLQFLQFDGSSLTIKRGLSGGVGMEDHTACAFLSDQNRCLSGTPKGTFFLWSGHQAQKSWQAHQGGINAITVSEGVVLSSGFTDKTLKVWDENDFTEKNSYPLPTYARSLDYKDGKVLAGTRDGQILSFEGQQQNLIMNGHGTGETWGLDISADGLVVTTGDDNKIITFDPKKNKAIAQGTINEKKGIIKKIGGASTLSLLPPNQQSRGVGVSSKYGHVAVATNDGELSIRKSVTELDSFVKGTFKISKEWSEVVKYSPNGQWLAVGSHDNNIYIFDASQNYQLLHTLTRHNSFITSVDWSEDGKHTQSVCGAYEYIFFNAENGQQQQSGATALRDEPWATFSCKLGWPVKGIFPPATDGSHVNGVDRSVSKEVFATGDDWGLVNLYRNPNDKGSQANSFRAHSSHVVRVKFDASDSYLYSVGGYDRTLMKWKVV